MAEHLAEAGVDVEQMTYDGVTHEFFGMGTAVPQAQEAVDMAVANLREAFEGEGTMEAGATRDATSETDATDSGESTETDAMASEIPDDTAATGAEDTTTGN